MIKSIRKPIKKYKPKPRKTLISPPKSNLFHPFLPEELIFSEILTRLPIKSLTQFKTVSKPWNSIISTKYFIKSHLKQSFNNPFVPFNCVFIKSAYYFFILNYGAYNKYPDNYNTEKRLITVKKLSYVDNSINTFLIGSFNGLVCFGRGGITSGFNYYFIVYNPIIGEFSRVCDPLGNFQWFLICGFCYVESKDDYLLFIGGVQKRSSLNYVYVFSMKSNTWKRIGMFSTDELSIVSGGRGVFVNDTLHWDTTQVSISNVKCVCGFNLVDERFIDVRVPLVFSSNGVGLDCKLCEISGCLGAWSVNTNGVVEMWMLKQYGAWDSWGMVFKIDMLPGLRNFCGWTENGKVLVHTDDGSLFLADPNKNPTEYKSIVRHLGDIDTLGFVRSPVSPFF